MLREFVLCVRDGVQLPRLCDASRITMWFCCSCDDSYRRRRAELAEAFAMFDRDSSGVVSGEELTGVLELMGLKDEAPRLAAAIVREIDLDGGMFCFVICPLVRTPLTRGAGPLYRFHARPQMALRLKSSLNGSRR